jgi:hypothetical protein
LLSCPVGVLGKVGLLREFLLFSGEGVDPVVELLQFHEKRELTTHRYTSFTTIA